MSRSARHKAPARGLGINLQMLVQEPEQAALCHDQNSRLARGWPKAALRRLIERLTALDSAHRRRSDLAILDDRMLRDIGISRGDVEVELRRPSAPELFRRGTP
jgi:uncharacterized protein YjiS (DUF1127 family)